MKYLIITLSFLFSCGGGYYGYSTPQCSEKATAQMEDIMIMEYVKRAAQTEVCTSMLGNKYHYIEAGSEYSCEPMPNVVNIECFSNCNTKFYSCLIFHEDGFVVEDVRRFGEERFVYD